MISTNFYNTVKCSNNYTRFIDGLFRVKFKIITSLLFTVSINLLHSTAIHGILHTQPKTK